MGPLKLVLFPPLAWIGLATALTYVFREPFSPKTAGWAGGYRPPGYEPPRPGYPGYVPLGAPAAEQPCASAAPKKRKAASNRKRTKRRTKRAVR